MKTSATNRRIRVLMTAIRDELLIPRPEFQRRLVWRNHHKESFLSTVLTDYPFPEIYVAAGDINPDTGEGTEMLVDGQQRLTTLYQYFSGSDDLKFKDIPPYAKLSDKEKLDFLEYEVVIRDLGNKSIPDIIEVFQRINSTQYSLNAMEIHNARFDGEFKKFTEELAEDNFFNDNNVFRTNDIRRMGDLVFCLSIIISVLAGYFNRDALHEEFLSNYNDEFPHADELRTNFSRVFRLINDCQFDPKCRVWRKADLLTLIIELYYAVNEKKATLEVDSLATALNQFYTEVNSARDNEHANDNVVSYHKAALQASNDRANRIRRGKIIAEIIQQNTK